MTNNVTNRWSISADLQLGPDEHQNLLLTFRERFQWRINLVSFSAPGHLAEWLLRVSLIHGTAHVLMLECHNIVSKHMYTSVNNRTQPVFL